MASTESGSDSHSPIVFGRLNPKPRGDLFVAAGNHCDGIAHFTRLLVDIAAVSEQRQQPGFACAQVRQHVLQEKRSDVDRVCLGWHDVVLQGR